MFDIEQELTDPERMSERVAFHGQLIAEEKAAAAICDRLLQGPSRWWGKALEAAEGTQTAGMVSLLISRAAEVLPKSPAAALDLADVALRIAERIDIEAYPYDHIVKLRGQALREKAYVLSYMGRYHEAAATAELAGALLQQIPIALLELARLDLVRSDIARNMEKLGQAIDYARRAGETFLQFGSRVSWLKARQFEGVALLAQGRAAEAREVCRSCETYFDLLDAWTRGATLHNIALASTEIGDREMAAVYFSRAALIFDGLGHRVHSAKCRYGAGKAMLAAGAYEDAIAVLERSWHELEELEAHGDAVLPALLLAEGLLVVGRAEKVPAICRMLIDRCSRNSMPSGAMTALAYLREALSRGHASRTLVRSIHDYMRDVTSGEKRPFRPEPAARFEL